MADRGAWCAAVHGVTKSQTWLSNWITTYRYLNVCKIYAHHIFICSSVGHFECFHILAITNNSASKHWGACIFLKLVFSFFSYTFLEVELLNHMVALSLFFLRHLQFSRNWLHQLTLPPTLLCVLPFLYFLTNSCCLWSSIFKLDCLFSMEL